MAQHDYSIANQGFPATRADINNVLSAISTNNSGTSAPSTQYAGQFWIDTTSSTWTLYIHDGADDIQFATIDTSANTVNFIDSALDVVTDTSPQLGGNLDLNSSDITGTGNINITGTVTATSFSGDGSSLTGIASDVVDDTTPQLGGNLDLNSNNITGTGDINITGNLTSTGIDDNATSTAITIDTKENVGIGVTPSDFSETYNSQALQITDVTSIYSMAVSTGDRRTIIGNNLFQGTDETRKFVTTGAKQGFVQLAEGRLEYHSDNNTGTAGASSSTSQRFQIDSIGNMKVQRNGAALNANSSHQLVDNLANSYSLMLSNKSSSPASQYMLEIGFKSASPDNNSARFVQCLDTTTIRAEIMSDGDFRSHDNSYGSTSDERIKQDIVDAGSQWDDIKAFRIRKYKKKDDVRQYGADEAKLHIGVIAQELETVSPGLIKEQEPGIGDIHSSSEFGELYQEGDTIPEGKSVGDIKTISANVKSVNYSVLYMKAIKALQEAMERIETLEAKVTALENA